MELSTYFRINAEETGQFERTLIIADEGSYVSYLEGCTAPQRDKNQLHAAVVELVALDDAEIKYSTVQNWYAGDKDGKGGIYNFVTKRGLLRRARNSKISWTQVETGSAITWKYPSCHSAGRSIPSANFTPSRLTNNKMQADTGTKMIHIGKNTTSTIVSKGHLRRRVGRTATAAWSRSCHGARTRATTRSATRCSSAQRCGQHLPLHRSEEQHGARRARGDHLEDQRRPDLLPEVPRHRRRRRRQPAAQRILQGRL